MLPEFICAFTRTYFMLLREPTLPTGTLCATAIVQSSHIKTSDNSRYLHMLLRFASYLIDIRDINRRPIPIGKFHGPWAKLSCFINEASDVRITPEHVRITPEHQERLLALPVTVRFPFMGSDLRILVFLCRFHL